jgi:hypothetical protein
VVVVVARELLLRVKLLSMLRMVIPLLLLLLLLAVVGLGLGGCAITGDSSCSPPPPLRVTTEGEREGTSDTPSTCGARRLLESLDVCAPPPPPAVPVPSRRVDRGISGRSPVRLGSKE